MVGVVVKSKLGGLQEEVRVGCSRRMRKELTIVVQGVLGNNRLLLRYQDG